MRFDELLNLLTFFSNNQDSEKLGVVKTELIYSSKILKSQAKYSNPKLRSTMAKMKAFSDNGRDISDLKKELLNSGDIPQIPDYIVASDGTPLDGEYISKLKYYYSKVDILDKYANNISYSSMIEPTYFGESIRNLASRTTTNLYNKAAAWIDVANISKARSDAKDFFAYLLNYSETVINGEFHKPEYSPETLKSIHPDDRWDFVNDCDRLYSVLSKHSDNFTPIQLYSLFDVLRYHYENLRKESYKKFELIGMYGFNDVKVDLFFDTINSVTFVRNKLIKFVDTDGVDSWYDTIIGILRATMSYNSQGQVLE